eukprot:SAG11_NODE_11935_length_730_cov_18.573693_1_plen_51_part_10
MLWVGKPPLHQPLPDAVTALVSVRPASAAALPPPHRRRRRASRNWRRLGRR